MPQGKKDLKYGPQLPVGNCGMKVLMGASEVIKAQSGRFVKPDGTSRRAEIAGDGDTELMGWVELHEHTTSATEGGTEAWCINDLNQIFRLPVDSGTWAVTMVGETCDLAVSSSIQGVQLDASAEDTVWLMSGDVTSNYWVDVRLNPNKLAVVGAAD